MEVSRASKIVGGLFALTGVLGLAILVSDKNLWKFAPTHAYGLIVFVIIDFVVAAYIVAKPSKLSFTAALAWSSIRILLQLADISSGPDFGFSTSDFANYLFNPVATYPPNPPSVPGALIDLMIVLEFIVIWVAWSARSSAQK